MKIKITHKYSIIYIRINNKISKFIKKRYEIISLEDFRVIVSPSLYEKIRQCDDNV